MNVGSIPSMDSVAGVRAGNPRPDGVTPTGAAVPCSRPNPAHVMSMQASGMKAGTAEVAAGMPDAAEVAARAKMGSARRPDSADVTAAAEMPDAADMAASAEMAATVPATEMAATEMASAKMRAAMPTADMSTADMGATTMTAAAVAAPIRRGDRGRGREERDDDDGHFQAAEPRHGISPASAQLREEKRAPQPRSSVANAASCAMRVPHTRKRLAVVSPRCDCCRLDNAPARK